MAILLPQFTLAKKDPFLFVIRLYMTLIAFIRFLTLASNSFCSYCEVDLASVSRNSSCYNDHLSCSNVSYEMSLVLSLQNFFFMIPKSDFNEFNKQKDEKYL